MDLFDLSLVIEQLLFIPFLFFYYDHLHNPKTN